MRFMPDSAVLGTIGHAKRRAAKRKARARRIAARRAARGVQPTAKHYMIATALFFGGLLVIALFG